MFLALVSKAVEIKICLPYCLINIELCFCSGLECGSRGRRNVQCKAYASAVDNCKIRLKFRDGSVYMVELSSLSPL